jgi:hypothetical protein
MKSTRTRKPVLKRVWALVSGILLLLSFSGCGSGTVTTDTVGPSPPEEGTLSLDVSTTDGQVALFGFDLSVEYDPARFEFKAATPEGGLFDGSTCALNTDNPGAVTYGCISGNGATGPGLIASFSFDYQGGEPSVDDFEISSTFYNEVGAPISLPGLDFTIDLN